MPDIDTLTLSYMHDEIVKEAFLGSVGRALARQAGKALSQKGVQQAGRYVARSAGDVGAGAGIGGLVGGVGGLGVGAVEGYRGVDPETGERGGVLGGFTKALERGGQGALGGAALGAAAGLGAGGRATASKAGKKLLQGGASNPLSVAGRLGQRQLHSVTGLVPGGAKAGTQAHREALRGMKMYGHDVAARSREAADAAGRMRNKVLAMKGQGAPPKDIAKAEKALSRLQKAEKALKAESASVDKAWDAGMTSLPGMAKAVKSEGAGALWRHGIKPQWQYGGAVGKGLMLAPAALAAPELLKETDEEGRGRAERFGRSLMETAAYTATPMVPILGSDVLGRGVGAVAGLGGKGIDKLIGAVSSRKKKGQELGESPGVPATDGDAEGGVPVERVMSNAAQGLPPEDMVV